VTEEPAGPAGERCAVAALRRGDPMPGTAAPAAGYLLLEQPGGWGRQALTSSRLDPQVGLALSARAISLGLRVLLMRRPGRHPQPERRRWAVVSSRSGREVTWWGDIGADEELLTLPLDGSAGTPSYQPFFLVCTHGRHDTCCAVEGRPVAAALDRVRPGGVWECSHVGGDRFAANVLAMPHGLYYGRVRPEDAEELVAAHDRGEVLPHLLRGQSTTPPAAQAAIVHARTVLGERRLEALAPAGTLHLGGGRWQVRLRHSPRHLMATVQATAMAEPGLLTCHAGRTAHAPRFEVVDLVEVG
jgi:(2Fe-2S) ferredoxin